MRAGFTRAGLLVLALCAAAAVPSGLARAAPTPEPRAIVETLNETLLTVMRQADELGYQGRFERLAPVLSESFDFPLMASVSVGRYWDGLTPAQRERLVDAFRRMSIGTFAARFDGYSGESFRILEVAEAPRDTMLVRNQLVKDDGETVAIDYLLRRAAGGWRVVDVFLDAKYSELAIKRSEYSSVVKNQGFESLLRRIEDKLAQLAAAG